ncbi:MAG: Gfo/Idh/MocA family protein [Aggregatilineales bacterium]
MSRLEIGFVGAGRIAAHHAKRLMAFGDHARLAAVADIEFHKAEQLASTYGARVYSDYQEMLAHEPLDALFILTPPTVRLQPIQAACDRRLAVFCEKPPSRWLSEAQTIADMLDQTGVINSVGFMYRWLQVVDKARNLLAEKKISCVQSLFACDAGLDPTQPRWTFIQEHTGGPLLEQAIHSLDVIRYLAGEIDQVSALGGNPILTKSQELTIEDSHALSLRFRSDAVGTHLHSWVHRKAIVQIRIFGVGVDLTVDLIPPGSLVGTINEQNVSFQPMQDDPYATQIAGFLDAVNKRDQRLVRSPYRDAVQSLGVTLAAIDSVSSDSSRTRMTATTHES